jgi:hypothetical protein
LPQELLELGKRLQIASAKWENPKKALLGMFIEINYNAPLKKSGCSVMLDWMRFFRKHNLSKMLQGRRSADLLLTSFGAHIPNVPAELQEMNVFPISTQNGTTLDLDYSSLMLMDRLILDRFAFEFISSRSHLKEMKTSIERLEQEGLLRIEDFKAPATVFQKEISSRVSSQLEYLDLWLDCAREQWRLFQPVIPQLLPALGKKADPQMEAMHFGIYCYLKETQGRIKPEEIQRLHKLLASKRKKVTKSEQDELKQIIRPLLSYVYLNYNLMQYFGAPFIDWEDMAPFYRRIAQFQFPDQSEKEKKVTHEMIDQAKTLFTVAIPELRPSSVTEFVRFVKKGGAVRSLREAMREAAETGTTIDPKWAIALRDQANKAQLTARKRSRIISLVGLLSLAFPWLPIANEVIKAAGETVGHMSQDLAGHFSHPKSLHHYKWYFALLQAKS